STGAGILAYDLFTLGRRVQLPAGTDPREAAHTNVDALHAATGWYRPLTGFEAGIWLMGMWVFGFMITLSLLSFNLPSVRVDGNPTLPYLLAGVGYVGMLSVTVGFVWRFLASLEARAKGVESVSPLLRILPAQV
ncbi:MAG: nitric-oxide reductase, partial [Rhodanobacter sp.]